MSEVPSPIQFSTVDAAIRSRRAIRGFRPQPVPLETVKLLLELAARSPSGSNIQPWKVRVVSGEAKSHLSQEIIKDVKAAEGAKPKANWDYYPVKWRDPYISRRRKVGWGLYGLLGIAKGDTEAAEAFRLRNYEFFDAPVGMIFTLDEDLSLGSWLDLGIFLGSLVTAARGAGLDTCLQQSFADVYATVHRELNIPPSEIVVCGLALGHADTEAPQNQLITEREPVDGFATFLGFEKP